MAQTNAVARPAATSWGAVLGGWIATLGASVIFAPIVAGLIGAVGGEARASDLALAVPVVLGILLSYLVGGYIAGRLAGYRTSWHGMMTAFFTLFILLLVLLLGAAADAGMFAGSGIRSLADVLPGVREMNVASVGDALSFGAILSFLAAIFGGWLGGVLAPSAPVVAVAPRAIPAPAPIGRTEPARAEHRRDVLRTGRLLPSVGRKGGERVAERHADEHAAAETDAHAHDGEERARRE